MDLKGVYDPYTEETRYLEYDYPPNPKPGEEAQPVQVVPGHLPNYLESTVYLIGSMEAAHGPYILIGIKIGYGIWRDDLGFISSFRLANTQHPLPPL